MKKIILLIGIILSYNSALSRTWERIIKETPVLDFNTDSIMLYKGDFNYQYPDRSAALSNEEQSYTIVCENISYIYPKKAIKLLKEEALFLIYKNNVNSLKCKQLNFNMETETVYNERLEDNIPLSCFQIKQPDFFIAAIFSSYTDNCNTSHVTLYLLNKDNNVTDTLLVNQSVSEFDPNIGGFYNLKQNTILRRSIINAGQENSRNLYEYFEIDTQDLKFKKVYYKESKRNNIKTLDELKLETDE